MKHAGLRSAPLPCQLVIFAASMLGLAGNIVGKVLDKTPDEACNYFDKTNPQWQQQVELTDPLSQAAAIALPKHGEMLLTATAINTDFQVYIGTDRVADTSVRRTGTESIILPAGGATGITLQLHLKPHTRHPGGVMLRIYDIGPSKAGDRCRDALRLLASGDHAYGQDSTATGDTAPMASTPAGPKGALAQYEKAYQVAAAGTPLAPSLRAHLALSIGSLDYQDLYEWREAAHWSALAAHLYDNTGDAYGAARAKALQAAAWMELAALPNEASATALVRRDSHRLLARAIRQMRALAGFHALRGEPFDEALQLNNIGLAHFYSGELHVAIAWYWRAAKIYAKLHERYRQAQALQNIAVAESESSQFEAAIAGYRYALSLLDRHDSPHLYADILNNTALVSLATGRLDEAIDASSTALDIFRNMHDSREEARSLFGLGRVYAAAGDYSLADRFLQQALAIQTTALDTRGRVDSLLALAFVAERDGRADDAHRYNTEALTLALDPAVRVRLINNIAEFQSRQHQDREAAHSLQMAAAIAATTDPATRATVDLERSRILLRSGESQSAARAAHRAATAFAALGLDARTFESLLAAAQAEMQDGHEVAGLHALHKAIGMSDHIRHHAAGAEMQAGLMQSLRPGFDLAVDLLSRSIQRAERRGDTVRARQLTRISLLATERYRAQVMSDLSQQHFPDTPNPTLLELHEKKELLLRELAVEQGAQTSSPKLVPATDVLRQLSIVDAQMAQVGTASMSTMQADTTAVRIPDEAALIAYWFTPSRLYAWIQGPHQALQFHDLGDAAPIRETTAAFTRAQGAVQAVSEMDRLTAGARLRQSILDPLLGQLPEGVKTLWMVPDGALHYISFATLPLVSGMRPPFLIEHFDVGYLPSATSRTVVNMPRESAGHMLLVSDPAYAADVDRLPGTVHEAQKIARVLPNLQIDQLAGTHASRQRILAMPLETYRFIHFAVHGSTNPDIPQLSSLLLSQRDESGRTIDGHVWAGDFITRRFNADTIVFSACESALGKNIGGEGLVGLRYVALARGARSVVSSLWKVPDLVTANLMADFYVALIAQHRSPESALAAAMRSHLQHGARDPALWGGFTVSRRTP